VKSKRDWMGYTALAMLFGIALLAVAAQGAAHGREVRVERDQVPARGRARIDGLDPELLQETTSASPTAMRNFAQLAKENGIHSLGTSTPPQSPVAWSNFITGLNPGGHGIFEFFHRDLTHRTPVARDRP